MNNFGQHCNISHTFKVDRCIVDRLRYYYRPANSFVDCAFRIEVNLVSTYYYTSTVVDGHNFAC